MISYLKRSVSISLLAAGLVLGGCSLSAEQEDTAAQQPAQSASISAAPTPQRSECENPNLDLTETQYGYWSDSRQLPTETGGEDDSSWLEINVIDNHFDPCAEFSYIITKVIKPEFRDSPIRGKEMALFFAGENLILEQKMPVLDEIHNVEINGNMATVDYRSAPLSAMGETFDYQINYELAAHQVTELGEHVPENIGQLTRSDFDRSPPPGDSGVYLKLGNVSYRPYDYHEKWGGEFVEVPIGDTFMICWLKQEIPYGDIERVFCGASEYIFPATDLRAVKTPLLAPGLDKYRALEITTSNPVGVYTDKMISREMYSSAKMEDEAITQVGRFIFDTRGETVRFSNGSWEFTIGTEEITKGQAPPRDTSRWPTDRESFASVG